MHVLLIIVLLVVALPMFARLMGCIVSILFWLLVAGTVVAIVGALAR
jgi:hypothetical protein